MVPILLDERYLDSLIQFHLQKQQEIRDHIALLQLEEKALSATIVELRQAQNKVKPEFSPQLGEILYNREWTWTKKIDFALDVAGRAMTSREIVDLLENYEPQLKSQGRKPIASVSAVLSTKSGDYYDRYEGDGDVRYMKKAVVRDYKEDIKEFIQTPLIVDKGPDDLPF